MDSSVKLKGSHFDVNGSALKRKLIMSFHNLAFLKSFFLSNDEYEAQKLFNTAGFDFPQAEVSQIIDLINLLVFEINTVTERRLKEIEFKFERNWGSDGKLVFDTILEWHSVIKTFARTKEFSHEEVPVPNYDSYLNDIIPVYIIEEHRDAYYIWNKAVDDGIIPRAGNLLLHIDHHDDMESGYYLGDISKHGENDFDIEQFTLQSLGIANFIAPAIFDKTIRDVFIFKNLYSEKVSISPLEIHREGNHYLTTGRFIPIKHFKYLREKSADFSFFNLITGSYPDCSIRPCILDVDLDYFLWDDSRKLAKKFVMEITEDSYREYRDDPYHPLRITSMPICYCYENDGKFFIEFVPHDISPVRENERITMNIIETRIKNITNWLKDNNIRPLMIDICRSNMSGCCPSDAVNAIENCFVSALKSIYPISVQDWEYSCGRI